MNKYEWVGDKLLKRRKEAQLKLAKDLQRIVPKLIKDYENIGYSLT